MLRLDLHFTRHKPQHGFKTLADLHPLQLYLKRVLVAQTVDLTKLNSADIENAMNQMLSATQMQYAMIIFTTLPIIFTYPFFQKYFIKGVMLGSLKG